MLHSLDTQNADIIENPQSVIAPSIRQFLIRKGVEEYSVTFAGSAGSQRRYYRLQDSGRSGEQGISYVLLLSPPEDLDFGRFVRITQFYRLLKFPVPKVFCIADGERQVLLEDLGPHQLYDKLHEQNWYRQALDTLHFLQTQCTQQFDECPDIASRVFDKEGLRWETRYFTENYLEGYRALSFSPREKSELNEQFDQLASIVASHPRGIMHRDFQSQNIMVHQGSLRVIDYQGSRMGSLYYDVASLLLDPYVMLSESEIEELFKYYHSMSLSTMSLEEGLSCFWQAGAQRIMQALGAYCYLSKKKGLREFERYIEPGEKRLQLVLQVLKGLGEEVRVPGVN